MSSELNSKSIDSMCPEWDEEQQIHSFTWFTEKYDRKGVGIIGKDLKVWVGVTKDVTIWLVKQNEKSWIIEELKDFYHLLTPHKCERASWKKCPPKCKSLQLELQKSPSSLHFIVAVRDCWYFAIDLKELVYKLSNSMTSTTWKWSNTLHVSTLGGLSAKIDNMWRF